MATKPKAGRPKKPPAKKMTQAEQSERFVKTAREIGVDESGKEFERLFRRVARPKPTGNVDGASPSKSTRADGSEPSA
jgi:hypothetical protein